MIRIFSALVLSLFGATTASASCAQDGSGGLSHLSAAQRDDLLSEIADAPFAEGNFWQVEKGGVTSYVFGTMHLYDPRHDSALRAIAPQLEKAEQLFMEMTHEDQLTFQSILLQQPERLFIQTGPSLIDLLGDEAWAKLSAQLETRGMPAFMAAKMQPWYAGLTLSIPACALEDMKENRHGIDRMIEEIANEAAMPTQSLDVAEDLIDLLSSDPLEQQVADMRWSLSLDLQDLTTGGSAIIDHYFSEQSLLGFLASRYTPQLGQLTSADAIKLDTVLDEFMAELIDQRNIAWMPTLRTELETTPSFVAMGALHLPGKNGVLALLQAEGFDITRLPISAF